MLTAGTCPRVLPWLFTAKPDVMICVAIMNLFILVKAVSIPRTDGGGSVTIHGHVTTQGVSRPGPPLYANLLRRDGGADAASRGRRGRPTPPACPASTRARRCRRAGRPAGRTWR